MNQATRTMAEPRRSSVVRRLQYFAGILAAATATLYVLIGLEVLPVGEPADGSAPDLLAFGLLVGGVFAVAAVLLLLAARRAVWLFVGLIQLVVLVGYFAMAEIREPPFAPWGLVVKALQLVILGVVVYLAIRGPQAATRPRVESRAALGGVTR